VFPRAYTCCPQPEWARKSLQSGRFPHAIQAGHFDRILPVLAADNIDLPAVLSGRDRRTILAYTQPMGDGVDSPLDPSLKVPLAICAPGLLDPRIAIEILFSTVDLAPTLLGLCGLPVPASAQGRDLSALLLGKSADLPDSVYIEGGVGEKDPWRAVIRGFDKLVTDLNGNVTHLYNLAGDPREETNLAQKPSTQLTRDALVALEREWMRRLGDGVDPSGLRIRP
ncbi:MAG: sulfatase/phosphatase domain-containing protein, partial [Terriglobia bacterium]